VAETSPENGHCGARQGAAARHAQCSFGPGAKKHQNLFFCAVAAKAGGYRTRVQIFDRAEVPSEIDRRREEERRSGPGAETAAV